MILFYFMNLFTQNQSVLSTRTKALNVKKRETSFTNLPLYFLYVRVLLKLTSFWLAIFGIDCGR
jgi:hypothetical protein